MKKIKAGLDKVIAVLCVVIFIAMVLLTTFQVTVRYVLKSPSSFSEATTRYLFVWLIILSATYVFGMRDHICINFLKDKLTGGARKVLNVVGECVIILFAAVIMIYGGSVITEMNMVQYDSILKIPTGTIYSIIPVCGVLIIFYSICNIMTYIKGEE